MKFKGDKKTDKLSLVGQYLNLVGYGYLANGCVSF